MFKGKRKIVTLMLVCVMTLATSIPGFAVQGKEGLRTEQGIEALTKQFTYAPEVYYEDIDAMVKVMEDAHVNLYHDISKEEFYKEIEALKASITGPISTEEFRRRVSVVVAKLKDGHTFVMNSQIFNELYYNDIGGLFPYGVDLVEDRFFIRESYDTEKRLPLKAEVLEINDIPVEEILESYLAQQSGEMDILKKGFFEGHFAYFYAVAMGFSDEFKVKYIPYGTEVAKSVVIKSAVYKDIKKDLDYSFYREPYSYEYLEDINAFYMKFDSFQDYEGFALFLEEMFAEIKTKESQDLIIDLRDNTGGNFGLGELLVSYLTDKPFRMTGSYINKYSKSYIDSIAESCKRDGYEVVYSENGMRIDCTKGEEHYYESVATYSEDDVAESIGINTENPYKGDVYVLIGNKSYSSAVMLAALLKDYKLATFIGEETGGIAGGYTCMSYFNMPNSNLSYSVAWQYFTRPSNVKCKRGVMPDFEVKEDLAHYFNDIDDVFEYAKEMIGNK